MGESVRTHFVLPRETLEEFDRRAPARGRSQLVAELMEEWIRRQRMKEVVNLAGFIKAEDHPEWQTSEDVYNWVRKLRNEWRDHYVESGDADEQSV